METDAERKETLLESEQNGEVQKLKAKDSWKFLKDEFNVKIQAGPPGSSKQYNSNDVIEIFPADNEERGTACDVPVPSGSTFTIGGVMSTNQFKANKFQADDIPSSRIKQLGMGKMVQTKIDFRKKEAAGLTSVIAGGQTLGSELSTCTPRACISRDDNTGFWRCLVCTL